MLRIPRVLKVYTTTTSECRRHLANYRKQPDTNQSQFHDQPPPGYLKHMPALTADSHRTLLDKMGHGDNSFSSDMRYPTPRMVWICTFAPRPESCFRRRWMETSTA